MRKRRRAPIASPHRGIDPEPQIPELWLKTLKRSNPVQDPVNIDYRLTGFRAQAEVLDGSTAAVLNFFGRRQQFTPCDLKIPDVLIS